MYSVSISSDGNYIVAGGGNKVYFFDSAEGYLWSYTVGRGLDIVTSVSISSDGSYIAATSSLSGVHLFDKNRNLLWKDDSLLFSNSVAMSSDGSYVVAGGDTTDWGGELRLYDRSGTILWSYQTTDGSFELVDISSTGQYIVASCADEFGAWDVIYLFNKENSVPLWSYEAGYRVGSVSISLDGSTIVVGVGHETIGKVLVFDRTSNTPLWVYESDDSIDPVDVSSDGQYIVAGEFLGGNIYFFNKENNEPLWIYQTGYDGVTYSVQSVSISSDGSYLAAGDEYSLYLFGKENNQVLWEHRLGDDVNSVSISAAGSSVVAGSSNGEIQFYFRGSQ